MLPSDFKLMLPMLKILSDGNVYSIKELTSKLSNEFRLNHSERERYNVTETVYEIEHRVGWARTKLRKACLIEFPEPNISKITDLGKEVLRDNIREITDEYLLGFNSYKEYYEDLKDLNSENVDTFEESIEKSYFVTKNLLSTEIIDRVLNKSPKFFEELVVELLLKMGYGNYRKGAGIVIGGLDDEGIDGIIHEDKLGLDSIYIQAKRWARNNKIVSEEIDKFRGALGRKGAKKGILITTSYYTPEAIKNANDNKEYKMVLIDGDRLADLMIEYNMGCVPHQTYVMKEIDDDFFDEYNK